jgi:hypothetical protein
VLRVELTVLETVLEWVGVVDNVFECVGVVLNVLE